MQWFLDGLEISSKRTEYKQVDDGESYRLIFGDVTTDMHGKYKCVIKNDYGKIEDECSVTVNCKPKIRKDLHDIEVNEGETLKLEVEIYAVPEPKIIWFKDGQEVRADARVKIQRDSARLETYNLTLNLIKREEAGVYEVKATNLLGAVTAKSIVTVLSEYFGRFGFFWIQGMKNWENRFSVCFTKWCEIVSKSLDWLRHFPLLNSLNNNCSLETAQISISNDFSVSLFVYLYSLLFVFSLTRTLCLKKKITNRWKWN